MLACRLAKLYWHLTFCFSACSFLCLALPHPHPNSRPNLHQVPTNYPSTQNLVNGINWRINTRQSPPIHHHHQQTINMRFSTLLVAGFAALTQATDAPIVNNNPNTIYNAVLPQEAFYHGKLNGNIRGSVRASRGPDGKGVKYKVHFENLPKEGGPFSTFPTCSLFTL